MEGLQVVCFTVGPYQCALEILAVREIIEPSAPSPVPNAAPGVEGVIELRGAFLPVVDLRKRLGVTAGPPGKYVVAQPRSGERIALVVDTVHDVRRWAKDALSAPPALAIGAGPPCVSGVVKQDDEVVMLLDLAQLLLQ
ncbi:MAG TPA: chemotaxis protein CheW [Kofleriaceae bacterium]|nr:chemotaxis protein CheW [Kofleriaceae bacterium]